MGMGLMKMLRRKVSRKERKEKKHAKGAKIGLRKAPAFFS